MVNQKPQDTAMQNFVNAKRFAMHPVRIERQNGDPNNIKQNASLKTGGQPSLHCVDVADPIGVSTKIEPRQASSINRAKPTWMIAGGVWHGIAFEAMLKIANQRPNSHKMPTHKVIASCGIIDIFSPPKESGNSI